MPQQVGEDYPEANLVMLIALLATNEIHSSILGYVHHKASDGWDIDHDDETS